MGRASRKAAKVEKLEALNAELDAQLKESLAEIRRLRAQVELLSKRLFGRKSERIVDDKQEALPFEESNSEQSASDTASGDDETSEGDEQEIASYKRRRRNGRSALPEDLPRNVIVLAPEDTCCPGCGEERVTIGVDKTEELEFEPARFYVNEYRRPKLACRHCRDHVSQEPLPERFIEKGRPGVGLLSYLVTSKYIDHLPLFRLEQIFARLGYEISRKTLSDWIGFCGEAVHPIVAEIERQLLASPWIQSDDTTLIVKDQSNSIYRGGHLWVYLNGVGEVLYDFSWQRNSESPRRRLSAFGGYLQHDAAPAYDAIHRDYPIIEVGCWAHARRYFVDAIQGFPDEGVEIVAMIRRLYEIERRAKLLTDDHRYELRQAEAVPRLAEIKGRLDALARAALPKSTLGRALTYALGNWASLTRYVEDGGLHIDNNAAERAIKPTVLGRKNWLFTGSEAATYRACNLMTLLQTAKAYGLDPYAYLRDVFAVLPSHPANRVAELTPRLWAERQASAVSADICVA